MIGVGESSFLWICEQGIKGSVEKLGLGQRALDVPQEIGLFSQRMFSNLGFTKNRSTGAEPRQLSEPLGE